MAVPLVVDIKRNSLDDGPGIRSVVFFKGCPLDCVWCQNPEGLSPKAELQPFPDRCLGCGKCVEVCSAGLARPGARAEACTGCGACVEACPAGARRIAGTEYALEDLTAELLQDKAFYRRSGGGVTLSGGEPLLVPEYAGALAAALAAEGVGVLVETAGLFDFDRVAEHVLPHLASVYFDLKLADEAAHRRNTGRGNVRILENLRRLVAQGFDDLLVRVPLIPGITAEADNLTALAGIIAELGLARVALLDYNPLWLTKRRALDLPMRYDRNNFMDSEQVDACRAPFEAAGLEVINA